MILKFDTYIMALPEKVNNVKNIPTKVSEDAYELSSITIRVGL